MHTCRRASFALLVYSITVPASASEGDAPKVVQFQQQPTAVGDSVVQQVEVELDVTTTITQSEQIAHESRSTIHRKQQRVVKVLEVVDDRVRRAEVSFPISRRQGPGGETPDEMAPQSVEGKTYLVERVDDRLKIRKPDGTLPPRQEFELVYESLKTFGKPNPLAEFLLARPIQLGETIEVPRELAEQLLGLSGDVGEVRRMTMRLEHLKEIDDQPCAVFATTIDAVDRASEAQEFEVTGRMAIDIATCRTVAAEVNGPLSLTSTQTTAAGSFEQVVKGGMRVALRSQYGARR